MRQKQTSPRRLLLAVCVAQFFLPFMLAGVNAVLPPIGADLDASARELGLVGTLYALGLAVFQLAAGRMGDVWGRRRIFLWGMGIFTVMGAVLGFVTDIGLMIGLRFIHGAGAAMFNASGLALLAAAAPPGMRGRYLGLSGAAVYAGIACGPPVAGFLAGTLGWRWLFWGNAPACLTAWALMAFTVRAEWRESKGEPFDWGGCLVYGIAMTALTLGGTSLRDSNLIGGLLLGTGLAAMIGYVLLELRTRYPLLNVRLLVSNRLFGLSSLAAFINYTSFFGMLFFFSIYLQVVRGLSVETTGLILSLGTAVQAATTPWAGRMADRHGAERISAVGIGLCGAALVAAAFLGRDTPLWHLMATQIILGLGVSLFAIPNTNVILGSVENRYLGQASGLVGAVRTGGGLVNGIIITMTLGIFLGHEPVTTATIEPFLESMHTDLTLFGILNLLAIGCALGRLRGNPH